MSYVQPDTDASSAPAAPAGGAFFGFATPKVDLSATFKPFTSGGWASGGSTAVRERQYTGGDTLAEPVWHTLRRDLVQIGRRLYAVVWPAQLQAAAHRLRRRLATLAGGGGGGAHSDADYAEVEIPDEADDVEAAAPPAAAADWDLWGPLIFSLAYLVALGLAAPNRQTNLVFSGTFAFFWLFLLAVGLNIQLLGGTILFLLAISASGYLLFPVVAGGLLCTSVVGPRLVRLVVMALLWAWSVYSGLLSLQCLGVQPGRVALAGYPVALMYAVMAWLCVIT
jgi:hypothetical protein